ncbi:hypothetical protein LCGC14_2035850, partial [marine sediment metagenome]
SNSDWPATEHTKIAKLVLKSAVTTGTDGGAYKNQNWNDYASGPANIGHLLHVAHRLRHEPAQHESGVALTLKNSAGAALTTGNSSTAVEIVLTTGVVFQLHDHTFPAFDMYDTATDDVHIVNQPTDEGGANETTVDLVTDITHYVDGTAAGVAIGTNKYFNLVVWGVQNREGEASHVMINLPTSQYNNESDATTDIDGTSVYDIPLAFKGTGFLIARLTFRLIAGSQWTYIAQEDLRGQHPGLSAGVGVTTTDHALLANLAFAATGHTGFQAQGDVLDDLNILDIVASDGQFIVGTGGGAFAYESGTTVRTSLGLGTGDTPEFTSLDIGSTTYAISSIQVTGSFAIKTSGDNSDYLYISTVSNVPVIGTVGTCDLKITSSSGEIDFDNENLTTAGTIASGVITQSGTTLANTYQPLDAELTSLAALSYASASFIKMTGAGTFALRTIGETADDLEGTIVHDNLASVHQGVTTGDSPTFAELTLTDFTKLKVYRNTNQTISDVTDTKIGLTSAAFDVTSEFDIVTDFTFTADSTGYYLVNASVTMRLMPSGSRINVAAVSSRANMTLQAGSHSNVNTDLTGSVNGLMYLQAGDTVYLNVWHNAGGDRDTNTGANRTFLCIARIA